MTVTIYVTLGICAALAGLLVYRYDLYDREPWGMVALAVAAGFGVMWFMGPLESFTIDRWPHWPAPPVVYALVAATHEELGRLAVVVALALFMPRHFNDPMDGIIYGSIVGLGMAVEESTFFLRLMPPEGALLPGSELVRLCGHLVMGGITGFGVGMMRMRMPRWRRVLAGCLAVSMGMHFLWDWIAFIVAATGDMQVWQTVAAVVLMLGGMLFYGMLVVVGADWSRRVFAPHSQKALWGWPLTLVVKGEASRHQGIEASCERLRDEETKRRAGDP